MAFYAGSQAMSAGGQSVNVEQIFEEVFQAHNQQEQLKAIKNVILIILCTSFLYSIIMTFKTSAFSSDRSGHSYSSRHLPVVVMVPAAGICGMLHLGYSPKSTLSVTLATLFSVLL